MNFISVCMHLRARNAWQYKELEMLIALKAFPLLIIFILLLLHDQHSHFDVRKKSLLFCCSSL